MPKNPTDNKTETPPAASTPPAEAATPPPAATPPAAAAPAADSGGYAMSGVVVSVSANVDVPGKGRLTLCDVAYSQPGLGVARNVPGVFAKGDRVTIVVEKE